MAQKQICRGDICRIKHNNSEHGFTIDTLVVIKECHPRFSEFPNRFKAATYDDWWWVEISDISVFAKNPNEDDEL